MSRAPLKKKCFWGYLKQFILVLVTGYVLYSGEINGIEEAMVKSVIWGKLAQFVTVYELAHLGSISEANKQE